MSVFKTTKPIPSPEQLASPDGYKIGYVLENSKLPVIEIVCQAPTFPLFDVEHTIIIQIKQIIVYRINSYATSTSLSENIEYFQNYVAALSDAIATVKYIEDYILADGNVLFLNHIAQLQAKQKELEALESTELAIDEGFGIKESKKLVKKLHTRAKSPEYNFRSGAEIFVPRGLNKTPFTIECRSHYMHGNAYFYKSEADSRYPRTVSRSHVEYLIANSSKAKTMFARLSN